MQSLKRRAVGLTMRVMEEIAQSAASLVGPKSARLDGTHGTAARRTSADAEALQARSADLTRADLIALHTFFELLDKWDREHHETEKL
jgi:hypothetical protein